MAAHNLRPNKFKTHPIRNPYHDIPDYPISKGDPHMTRDPFQTLTTYVDAS